MIGLMMRVEKKEVGPDNIFKMTMYHTLNSSHYKQLITNKEYQPLTH